MKTTAIGVLPSGEKTEWEPREITTIIEKCVNEILDKHHIKRIEIATSLHQQDYDALTIRVIGWW